MNFWKSIVILGAIGTAIFIAGCGNTGETVSQSKTYVVGTRGTSRPASYVDDNGNLTGYDVELLKEIEKRTPGIHFEFKTMSIDAAFVAMDAGQVDLIANQMVHSPARDKKYIFPKELNNYSVRKLAVKKGRTDIQTLDDLRGKTVAVTTNSEFNTLIQEYNKTAIPPVNIIYVEKGAPETINLVATGRADAAGEYVYNVAAARNIKGLPVESVGPVLKVIPTYFLLRKSEDTQKLADQIDTALKDMRSDGTMKKLSLQFFDDDYTVEPKS